jgi:hypothetical protein
MSGEQFDSGAVLSRATPVLTFGSLERAEAAAALRSSSVAGSRGAGSTGDDSPAPSLAWNEDVVLKASPREPSLPVISHIVRRTSVKDGAFGHPVAAAARAARRAGVSTLFVGALGLATLGAIAGLGMRSLSDEATIPATAAPAPALVTPAHISDAIALERLLSRSAPPARMESAPAPASALAPASTLAHTPSHAPAHPPAHAHPLHAAPPPHQAFAAAHAAHAAARKHPAATALARR